MIAGLVGLGVAVALAAAGCSTIASPPAGGEGSPNESIGVVASAQPVGCGEAGGLAPSSAGDVPSPACSHPPSAPPGSVAANVAIAAARAAVGDTAGMTQVVRADVSPNPWPDTLPGHPWVWDVYLQGPGIRASACPSDIYQHTPDWSAPPCIDTENGVDVILDAFTGRLLGFG
jgi:hypothetical protein